MSEQYSLLARIPDHVRPDWLRGAYEVIENILALDPNYLNPGRQNPGKEPHYENRHNIALAKKIKADLDRRFGGPPAP